MSPTIIPMSKATATHRLCKLSEAAVRLDVSETTVRRFVRSGRLTAYRIGSRIRINLDEVDQILQGVPVGGPDDAA